MYVAGIDAHTRYVVVVVINRDGELVLGPTRVSLGTGERLQKLLEPFRPLEAIVETSPTWPWLSEKLAPGVSP